MSDRDFELVGEDVLHTGRIISLVNARFRYPDGEIAEREIVRHPGAVGIVAHDGTSVFLVRQPREAIGDPDCLEIPAGRLDKAGEPPEDTARRELAEEIGRWPNTLEHLKTFYGSVGVLSEPVHVFLGTDLEERSADSGENERIELVAWPLDDLDGAIAATSDAKTIIGLTLLRERLRAVR